MLFAPSIFFSIRIYIKLSRPDPLASLIKKYYKVKLFSAIIWIIFWALTVYIRVLNKYNIENIIAEGIFVLVGAIFEVYYIASLYRMYLLASEGEPMQPAEIGIEMKLENTFSVEPVLNEFVIQATEIHEVKSLPTKEFIKEQTLAENQIGVIDFTVRDLGKEKLSVYDFE